MPPLSDIKRNSKIMGLDMVPMGKPKPGKESEFKKLYLELIDFKEPKLSWLDKLKGKRGIAKEELLQQWFDIQIPAFETLGAPMVGRDEKANEWAKNQYENSDKNISETEYLKKLEGHYVVDLAEDSDGIVNYISTIYDSNVFRGQFLEGCIQVIGEDLISEAWETKFAEDALDYAHRLILAADSIAVANNMEYLKDQREVPEEFDEFGIKTQLHVVYSLARWLIYYGERGHGYEADF